MTFLGSGGLSIARMEEKIVFLGIRGCFWWKKWDFARTICFFAEDGGGNFQKIKKRPFLPKYGKNTPVFDFLFPLGWFIRDFSHICIFVREKIRRWVAFVNFERLKCVFWGWFWGEIRKKYSIQKQLTMHNVRIKMHINPFLTFGYRVMWRGNDGVPRAALEKILRWPLAREHCFLTITCERTRERTCERTHERTCKRTCGGAASLDFL